MTFYVVVVVVVVIDSEAQHKRALMASQVKPLSGHMFSNCNNFGLMKSQPI